MTGFFQKLQSGFSPSTLTPDAKGKLQMRDSDDPRVVYKLSNRARRISLRVNASEREVIVIVPGERALKKAREFAQAQKDWIDVQLESLPEPLPFLPGGQIPLRGELYTLIHSGERGRPRINHDRREIYVPGPEESFAGRVRRLLIREAREELEAASHHYADKVGKRVGKVSIRDTRSRWGSCITRNGEGHMSYSWRLISAPAFVLDYVAAHECAHLVHADHSKSFWELCRRINPDVKQASAWLRKNGAHLHAVGADY